MLQSSQIKVGMLVYRRWNKTKGKRPNKQKGIVIEKVKYNYVYTKFLIEWEDGKREWKFSVDLRLTEPGTADNERGKTNANA